MVINNGLSESLKNKIKAIKLKKIKNKLITKGEVETHCMIQL